MCETAILNRLTKNCITNLILKSPTICKYTKLNFP